MSEPQKILVIDDDAGFSTAITPVLQSRGYKVEAAYNKAEAMEKIETVNPDLIILDIMMERITDGFDICRKLKNDSQMKHVPVLAVSAITEKTGFKLSAFTEGQYCEADDYLAKPIKPDDLLHRVEKLLKR